MSTAMVATISTLAALPGILSTRLHLQRHSGTAEVSIDLHTVPCSFSGRSKVRRDAMFSVECKTHGLASYSAFSSERSASSSGVRDYFGQREGSKVDRNHDLVTTKSLRRGHPPCERGLVVSCMILVSYSLLRSLYHRHCQGAMSWLT
jgi:hypothetical protein